MRYGLWWNMTQSGIEPEESVVSRMLDYGEEFIDFNLNHIIQQANSATDRLCWAARDGYATFQYNSF